MAVFAGNVGESRGVAKSEIKITQPQREYHGPIFAPRVKIIAGTASNAQTTQKSKLKRNGRSIGCMI